MLQKRNIINEVQDYHIIVVPFGRYNVGFRPT